MTLVAIEVRTNYRAQANPAAAKIPGVWLQCLDNHLGIACGIDPKITSTLYANGEGDFTGSCSCLVAPKMKVLAAVLMAMAAIKAEAADFITFDRAARCQGRSSARGVPSGQTFQIVVLTNTPA